jgi:hypothetical protein
LKHREVVLETNFSPLYFHLFPVILFLLLVRMHYGTLMRLDKGEETTETNLSNNEGERTLLSSNKGGIRSPSLDFLDTSAENVTEEMILDYLAQIISSMYLKELRGANNKTSSHLLPGINKRTSGGRQ